MPVSNDNQDYNNPENKKESEKGGQQGKATGKNEQGGPEAENNMTSDNLKGKKVDADVEKETDKPADV